MRPTTLLSAATNLTPTLLRSSLGELDATFVPGAGMVATSLQHRGAELLGTREGLERYAEGHSTMGIPLLHPWANRLQGDHVGLGGQPVDLSRSAIVSRDENGLPIHGLLGGSPHWKVFASTSWAIGAELDFAAHPELLELFPFPHRLVLRADLGARSLTVRTTLTAGPDGAVPVSFGFHPYLRLPEVMRSTWRIELPAMEHLTVDAHGMPTGASDFVPSECFVLGARTYDDGYATPRRGTRFTLSGGGRRVAVRFDAGYPFAQVYAPADDDVICFEPMTAPTNALVSGDGLTWVPAGSSYTATFSISVS
jgi:galactose mutarotase-like enzyme